MRWPWVGVGRLDDAREEVAYLRAELARALDHNRRMDRKEAGLPETPKQAREPMPADILAMCEQWESPDIQRRERRKAETIYAITQSWDSVREKLQPQEVDADA